MLSFKFPINATTNQRGFFFIFFHIVLKNYISPHNQTNQHIRGSSILLAPCFLAFPFSFLSSSQVPLSLSFSHAPIHSLTTVVVSFESKRIIKNSEIRDRGTNCLCNIIVFYGCSKLSFNTPVTQKKTRSLLQRKKQQHKIKEREKKKKKLQWLTHRVLFLFTVHSLNKNPIYCSNLNPLAS